jgi:hypothetical protein
VPVGDHLARVEVWHDVANSRLSGLALQARGGQRQVFGQQVGAFQAFDAPVGSEIVGLRGTANAAVPSLGVVHRPLLGGYVAAGVACGSNVGVLTARFRAGEDRVRVGDAAVVEVTNVASPFGIVAIGFTALAVPLDAAGAPGCWVYSSAEALLLAPKDAANIAATPFQVPPSVVLVGVRLELQGGSLLAPNMLGLATSGALRVQVGAL